MDSVLGRDLYKDQEIRNNTWGDGVERRSPRLDCEFHKGERRNR